MMNGHTLLEALIASTLLVLILLSGYLALDRDRALFETVRMRTRAEEESNYRMQTLKAVFSNCAEKLQQSDFTANAPYFFPDLNFGIEANPSAFSIARPFGAAIRLQKTGSRWCGRQTTWTAQGNRLLLSGADSDGRLAWAFASVRNVETNPAGECYVLSRVAGAENLPLSAYAVQVELHGFLHSNDTLYWITPGGQAEPFFSPLDSFSYRWQQASLLLQWQRELTDGEFRWRP